MIRMGELKAMEAYAKHYQEKIQNSLSPEAKLELAKKISNLTLEEPIWMTNKDYSDMFPELKTYTTVPISGLYLYTMIDCLMKDITNGQHNTLVEKMIAKNNGES
jgi:hypothetical protein